MSLPEEEGATPLILTRGQAFPLHFPISLVMDFLITVTNT